jgi:hypothetical protein
MQFLGPKLNGCIAVLLSFAKRGSSPRWRSGMNCSGRVKLEGEWLAASWEMDTTVWKESLIVRDDGYFLL